MKRIITIILICSLFYACFPVPCVSALELSAKSAVLIDGETGRVLYGYNHNDKMTMASTTKIMTALVALENGNLDDIVTVSLNAAYQEGSSMYLKIGEKIALSSLIWGLMLASGNDAAVAIAEHICGSVSAFADLMTKKAHEIGAVSTSFKNPSGLDEEGHYTTARDLAIITKKALENETFLKIVSTKNKTLEGAETRHLTNHNKLLSRYEGCIGVKTGFTKKSGRTLVSAAERDGWRVIAVTLGAPDDWNDHEKMLDYAYNNYKKVAVSNVGDLISEIAVRDGETEKVRAVYSEKFHIWLTDEEKKRLEIKTNISSFLDAPVYVGQRVGESIVTLDGNVITRIPVYTADCSLPPEKDSILKTFLKLISLWSAQLRADNIKLFD